MNWQTALTIFYVFWLVAVLALLAIIYRSSQKRLGHVEELEKVLIVDSKDAHKAAQKAADAAFLLAEELTKKEKK